MVTDENDTQTIYLKKNITPNVSINIQNYDDWHFEYTKRMIICNLKRNNNLRFQCKHGVSMY